MPTNSWVAPAPGVASDPTLWSLGRIPADGDDINIGNASDNNCSWDLARSLGAFDMTDFAAGSIVTLSQPISVTSLLCNVTNSYLDGSRTVTCSGNAVAPNSSVTRYSLAMTTDGSTLRQIGGNALSKVTISANVTMNGSLTSYSFETAAGKELAIEASYYLQVCIFSGAWTNNGLVSGAGSVRFYARFATTYNLNLGQCDANVEIRGYSAATVDSSMTLTANAHFGGSLTVVSDSAYLVSLLHGTNYTLEVDGLTTLSTRGKMEQGTGAWAFDGGYTQNGASSVFTMGGPISSSNALLTAGSLVGNTGYSWTCNGNFRDTGVVTSGSLKVIMTLDGSTIQCSTNRLKKLTLEANVTTLNATLVYSLMVSDSKVLTVNHSFIVYYYSGSTYENLGTIAGSSSLSITIYNLDMSIALGNVTAQLNLEGNYSATANRTLTILDDPTLGPVSIYSISSGSYTMTVLLNGHTIAATLITVAALGIVSGAGIINAPVTVSLGLLTQTGDIAITGLLTVSGGTLTGDGTNRFKLGAGINHTSGTITQYVSRLEFTANGDYRSPSGTIFYRLFQVNAGITVTTYRNFGIYGQSTARLEVQAGALLNTGGFAIIDYYFHNAVIAGRVLGDTYTVNLNNALTNPIITGSIESLNFRITEDSSSRTFTLSRDLVVSGDIVLYVGGGTALALNLGGYAVTCNNIDIQASCSITGSGTINALVYATAGTLANNGELHITGLVVSGGSFLPTDDTYIGASGWVQTSGTSTGQTGKKVYLSGPLTINGGTFTSFRFNIVAMTNLAITSGITIPCYGIETNPGATVTVSGSASVTCFIFKNSGILDLSNFIAYYVGVYIYPPGSYENTGQIVGGRFRLINGRDDPITPVALGNITSIVELTNNGAEDSIIPLGANFSNPSITVYGNIGTNSKLTLDLNGYDYAGTLAFGNAKGCIKGGEGHIDYSGNWDTSLGEWDPETCEVRKTGTGTEKLGAGQAFYDYRAEVNPLNLASDVIIQRNYIHARRAVLNGFTLTLTDPSKEVRLFDQAKKLGAGLAAAVQLHGQMSAKAQLGGQYIGTN